MKTFKIEIKTKLHLYNNNRIYLITCIVILGRVTLQKALQEAELKIKALNTLIDVAEEQLKIEIRKKSGAKQS